jgi:hypothetical protein
MYPKAGLEGILDFFDQLVKSLEPLFWARMVGLQNIFVIFPKLRDY